MQKVIIRLNDTNSLQKSPDGVKLNKICSSISPSNFIKLLEKADNKVNPRIAKANRITKSIQETLESSPELLWLKAKGILLATESCTILQRNRVELTFENVEYEGIMDGGHTTFAIASYIIEKLFEIPLKTWDEIKAFINTNSKELAQRFEEHQDDFKFSIPVEIITPNEEPGALNDYYDYISEICSARNNNVQLNETAKGNQVGYYDYLKEVLRNRFDVIWKTGDSGKFKSEDVISLATLPLIFLKNQGILPDDLKGLNKISLYSQKSKCVDFFNAVMAHKEVSELNNGKYILESPYVQSALRLTEEILRFFDRIYMKFPDLYHKASPGRFGGISAVDTKRSSKAPFGTVKEMLDKTYPHGFIYPLIAGLTSNMVIDEQNQKVKWKVNPSIVDLNSLDLTQYVNIIKLANFDPQKVGKGDVFYREAETIFEKI